VARPPPSPAATRPITDLDAYRDSLDQFVYQTGMFMRPVFVAARAAPARVVYAEGEDERAARGAGGGRRRPGRS
jgi:malate dehydrogenase (oxaloacetate-decarboxylating)(NADP+)